MHFTVHYMCFQHMQVSRTALPMLPDAQSAAMLELVSLDLVSAVKAPFQAV